MVYRIKDLSQPPRSLMDAKWDSLRSQCLTDQDAHDAKSACYRDCTLDALILLYENKCGVCERQRGDELEIDHYRPKKSRQATIEPEYDQPGYYWLTYEWSNLVPLCSLCNRKKSNKFPIVNTANRVDYRSPLRVNPFPPYDRGWLQAHENPLLVNPECENQPAKHFIYGRDGKVYFRTASGEETGKVYALNRRELVRNRLKAREFYTNMIKEALIDYANHRDISELKGSLKAVFRCLRNGCSPSHEFSLLHIYMYRYFDYFIDRKLPVNLRGVALRYFNEFKQKNVI